MLQGQGIQAIQRCLIGTTLALAQKNGKVSSFMHSTQPMLLRELAFISIYRIAKVSVPTAAAINVLPKTTG